VSLVKSLHARLVSDRRVRVLCDHLASVIPSEGRVLDVGCGDGRISREIGLRRPDLELSGIDVFVRADAAIPVSSFDGTTIPADDGAFDTVLFVDVLHHTDDPLVLLREARRVCRRCIVIKDHNRNGILAGATLRLMDRVGNNPDEVALPYNYWRRERWQEAFSQLELRVAAWEEGLGLFLVPADWIFGRSLHFVARLEPQ
jgi:SAM-dependent methyltransferase